MITAFCQVCVNLILSLNTSVGTWSSTTISVCSLHLVDDVFAHTHVHITPQADTHIHTCTYNNYNDTHTGTDINGYTNTYQYQSFNAWTHSHSHKVFARTQTHSHTHIRPSHAHAHTHSKHWGPWPPWLEYAQDNHISQTLSQSTHQEQTYDYHYITRSPSHT